MGYSTTATTVTLRAKLTPFGRQQLLANQSTIVTSFSLGDSDANYNATLPLSNGEIPEQSGDIGVNSSGNNGVMNGYRLRSSLIVNTLGDTKKRVNVGSTSVNVDLIENGYTTLSANSLTFDLIDSSDNTTDSLVNLFYSFYLPINESDKNIFSGLTFNQGGFSDTAVSGFNTNKVLVIGIDGNEYGEMIDGKSIKLDLITSANTYSIYSTYENTLTALNVQDAKYQESSRNTAILGNNIAFLFSDLIKTPNNDGTKSWGTGHGTVKPFSVNNKSLYNLRASSSVPLNADEAIGIAFLDKGFIVITNSTIVDSFNESFSGNTGTTLEYNHVSNDVYQQVTCIAERGEFAKSNNATFSNGDVVRISDVGLYDSVGNLIAVAKTNQHVIKRPNQFLAFGVKICV